LIIQVSIATIDLKNNYLNIIIVLISEDILNSNILKAHKQTTKPHN